MDSKVHGLSAQYCANFISTSFGGIRFPTLRSIVLIVVLLFISLGGYAHETAFDTTGATGLRLSIESSDTPSNPNNYRNGSNYSTKPGYLGRLLYWGDGITVQCINGGPDATGTVNDRFYYVMDYGGGSTDNAMWREYFLVARVRGVYHNGTIADVDSENVVLEHPGDSLQFPGAGLEELTEAGPGYDDKGRSGTFDGSNKYKYKYRYKLAFADLTVIRTAESNLVWPFYFYYFISRPRFLGPGVDLVLSLIGTTRWSGAYGWNVPDSYSFTVDRIVVDPIPYPTLVQHDSYANVLPVGIVRFQGFDANLGAHLWFASNPSGTQTDFRFSSTIAGTVHSFPYELVYEPAFPSGPAVRISSVNDRFASNAVYLTVVALGTQMYQQYIEGQLGIYVPSGTSTTPLPPGLYSSVVYCCLEVD